MQPEDKESDKKESPSDSPLLQKNNSHALENGPEELPPVCFPYFIILGMRHE